jgi:hypothetical protein
MPPIELSDSQMACVQDAARHIPPFQRLAFLEAVAAHLRGRDFSDADVQRAARAAANQMRRARPGRLTAATIGVR